LNNLLRFRKRLVKSGETRRSTSTDGESSLVIRFVPLGNVCFGVNLRVLSSGTPLDAAPNNSRAIMKTIAVVDLGTGCIQARGRNTLTLDIPHDLDWRTGGVSVDAKSFGHYFTSSGQRLVYATMPTLLSGRELGANCLVADDLTSRASESCLRRYRLSAVERRH
jgi:hypothetical protein